VQWAKLLHHEGFPLTLLSNMPLELSRHVTKSFPSLSTFEYLIYSCDYGSLKPELAIYRNCLELLKAAQHDIVERRTELLHFETANDRVIVRLRRPDGAEEMSEVAYLAGCDGAHSAVREALEIGFPGGIYTHLFYVADVEGSGAAMNGDIHVSLERTDFLAVFPLKGEGRARLVGTIRDQAAREQDKLDWSDVSKGVIESMRIKVERVNWFSTYRVHHRVADHFRRGRAFLLGDAAHIHSPVGGQGVNTGIGDAINLAWKLASVLHGRADTSLLDSYEPE